MVAHRPRLGERQPLRHGLAGHGPAVIVQPGVVLDAHQPEAARRVPAAEVARRITFAVDNMHQGPGKALAFHVGDGLAQRVEVVLGLWVGGRPTIGGVTAVGADQALRHRGQRLAVAVADEQAGLQVVTDIRPMRDGVGVRLVAVLVAQA